MKKNYLFRTALMALTTVTVLVDLSYIVLSLAASVTGIGWFGNYDYGFEAVVTAFVLYGYVFWPLLLGCLIFNICAITYLIKTRKYYDKTEHMQYLRVLGRKMKKPVLALLAVAAVALLADVFFNQTYYGAVLKYKLGFSADNIEGARYLELDFSGDSFDSVYAIEKNGTLIYVAGQYGENENIDFLQELYYEEYCDSGRHSGDFDISGADEYIIWDRDGIEIETIYKKGAILRIGERLYKPLTQHKPKVKTD